MKKFLLALFLFMAVTAPSRSQDKFLGNWGNAGEDLVVAIYKQDAAYYAKVVRSKNPEAVGKIVLVQMEKKSDDQLFGGTFYDFDLKSEYEARLKLVSRDTLRLKILTGFFNKTLFWHRVKADWEEKTDQFTVLRN